ncbi:hypothetical protein SAMD00019534_026080 [Acytostelium subglobosum LB1]|uniref:hypothetical protein n=1 Tax=Acytostelium subglobosum LB1 TaxID=1410327 RepID=UPI000644DADF|nr:hypothetical protein SAMD00019534_026080 [Acytostelium subglobosum LB1]GAM19433.1 hypothetical protein SAMD00019534_026080 [Acytostelium subglobosum LB1]|eukprot:XP_012757360.1 hypothetical protein SAMD00019534_026080 [Acytostelium subglobosum LB1]
MDSQKITERKTFGDGKSFLNGQQKRPLSSATKATYMSSSAAVSQQKNVPIGRVVYDILTHLKSLEGEPATFEELMASTPHRIEGNQELIDSLRANPKIEFLNDTTLCFKPLFDVKSPKDIIELLSKYPYGITMGELRESYRQIEQDVNRMRDAKEIFVVKHNEKADDQMLFYNDERYRIPVSAELVNMWKDIVMPKEVDLESTMKEAGLSLVEFAETARTIKAKQVEKKEKKRRVTKVTNVHIQDFDPNAN